jgi:hypothetical protein
LPGLPWAESKSIPKAFAESLENCAFAENGFETPHSEQTSELAAINFPHALQDSYMISSL